MSNSMSICDVKISVDFGSAVVGVRRHGVPCASRLDHGESHDELATFDAIFVDILIKVAFVDCFRRAKFEEVGICYFGVSGGVAGVGRVAENIKFSRCCCVIT